MDGAVGVQSGRNRGGDEQQDDSVGTDTERSGTEAGRGGPPDGEDEGESGGGGASPSGDEHCGGDADRNGQRPDVDEPRTREDDQHASKGPGGENTADTDDGRQVDQSAVPPEFGRGVDADRRENTDGIREEPLIDVDQHEQRGDGDGDAHPADDASEQAHPDGAERSLEARVSSVAPNRDGDEEHVRERPREPRHRQSHRREHLEGPEDGDHAAAQPGQRQFRHAAVVGAVQQEGEDGNDQREEIREEPPLARRSEVEGVDGDVDEQHSKREDADDRRGQRQRLEHQPLDFAHVTEALGGSAFGRHLSTPPDSVPRCGRLRCS